MESKEACEQFSSLVAGVTPASLEEFLLWTKDHVDGLLENLTKEADNEKIVLDSIRDDVRQSLPIVATTPTETIVCPTSGTNADCDPATTVHMDAFLYDEETIDDLCDAGEMSRNYCTSCLSKAIKPLTFITHSASVGQMKFMYEYLLQDMRNTLLDMAFITHSASVGQMKFIYEYLLQDMRNKTLLDVGSRTGALLYGAHLYSEAVRIIGVELDKTFCELQQSIVQKYDMASRVQIIHSDIMLQSELLRNCDVIILNNVFEFFMPVDKQVQIWQFLFQTVRRAGTILITIPSIEESLENVKCQLDLESWLAPVDIDDQKKCAALKYFNDSEDSDLDEINMYRVL